jgi:hypothetical protein
MTVAQRLRRLRGHRVNANSLRCFIAAAQGIYRRVQVLPHRMSGQPSKQATVFPRAAALPFIAKPGSCRLVTVKTRYDDDGFSEGQSTDWRCKNA